MSVIIKTKEEIEIIREGAKILAKTLDRIAKFVKPGISTFEIDQYAYKIITEGGDIPASLNYRPEGAKTSYPASICISVNNEIVHGIPSKKKIIKEVDIVSLDLVLKHKGLFSDHAVTIPVGNISKRDQKLLDDTLFYCLRRLDYQQY